MKILIVEDDELKHQHLEKFIMNLFPKGEIDWKKSYQKGLEAIMSNYYDLILLDMSMHIYEKTAQESGGSFETYAGRMILSEIDINEIKTKVIVITGYDVYGDGKTLDTLKEELRSEFGDFYLDTVYFIGSEDKWKKEILYLLKKHFAKSFIENSNNVNLSILIVEDSEYKIEKVKDLISKVVPNFKLTVAKDQIEAQRKLLDEKFDLLILDMQLPNRFGESEPEKDGGEKILEELHIDESYKQPTSIIALTQYDELQNRLRDSFADIAAIKFDSSSDKWKDAITRVLSRVYKAKIETKKVIYCEGENASLYNLLGFSSLEFRGLQDCRAIYLAAVNEKDKLALRDRDFLTNNEIKRLQHQHKNYIILEYYCFENYIYHPDNIYDLNPAFDKQRYIEDLLKQKKSKLMVIIQDYKLARNGYLDLTSNDKSNMDQNPEDEIIQSLESDDFEKFYKFFDMAGKKDKNHKKSYDKTFLNKYNLTKEKLVSTNWFKTKISEIINRSAHINI